MSEETSLLYYMKPYTAYLIDELTTISNFNEKHISDWLDEYLEAGIVDKKVVNGEEYWYKV